MLPTSYALVLTTVWSPSETVQYTLPITALTQREIMYLITLISTTTIRIKKVTEVQAVLMQPAHIAP